MRRISLHRKFVENIAANSSEIVSYESRNRVVGSAGLEPATSCL